MTKVPQPWTVLIPDRLSPPAEIEASVFPPDTEILTPCATQASEIPDVDFGRAEAVLAWHELTFDGTLLDKLESCRALVRVGAGYDNVDLEAAGQRGIVVCNIPDYGTGDVADHAMALLLSIARGIDHYHRRLLADERAWTWRLPRPLRRLAGSTLGIIGLGRIGTGVARRARAFGMNVVFYDPYREDGWDKALGFERVEALADLLERADAISFHAPLTSETRGMADAAFFARCKKGVLVVNTARGGIIDLDAFHEALRSGQIGAAAMDVLPHEPPDDKHPLIFDWRNQAPWIAGRLVITPHAAFFCEEAYAEMRRKAAEEANRILLGKPPRNCVNSRWLA